MSTKTKQELLEHYAQRYRSAGRAARSKLLDEVCALTGYHRKYAISRLNHPPLTRQGPARRPRGRKYGADVHDALTRLWKAANCICARRLVPFLPDLLEALQRHGELALCPEVEAKVKTLSIATADRLLQTERNERPWLNLGTTRPGTLLKHQIPVRTFADWDDARPGFTEVDLVAHCGPSTHGEYLNSLVLTDVSTGWTEPCAVLNRSLATVTAAISRAHKLLPFDLLGLDSDNGSEFINYHLLKYCEQHKITFTRGRAYKKNDQCFVEQKNYTVVRQSVGYDRFEGEAAYRALEAMYRPLRLYVNFFQPCLKLSQKTRDGNRVTRRYDAAKTPCQRVLAQEGISAESKKRLAEEFAALNPVALLEQIQFFQDELWRHAKVRNSSDATIPLK